MKTVIKETTLLKSTKQREMVFGRMEGRVFPGRKLQSWVWRDDKNKLGEGERNERGIQEEETAYAKCPEVEYMSISKELRGAVSSGSGS